MRKGILIPLLSLGLLCSCGGKTRTVDEPTGRKSTPKPATALEWTKKTYVDEFGQPTNAHYEMTALEGKFSNSATTNSKLYVALIVERDSVVAFRLGEYGSHIVKDMRLDGKARNERGDVVNFYLRADNNGWATYIPVFTSDFVKMLASGERIDIVMTEDSEYGVPSTYRFTIPANSGIGEAIGRVQK